MGIIYNPSNDEMYTAMKGQGAFLNGKKLKTSNVTGKYKKENSKFNFFFLI